MDIENIDLLQLQTTQMKNDPTTQGLCLGLNDVLNAIYSLSPKQWGILMAKLSPENVNDSLLSQLAYDVHMDWYDSTASFEDRLNSVLKSKYIYQHLGTPAAIEEALQPYFESVRIEEWFEYGGTPKHYRIVFQGMTSQNDRVLKILLNTSRPGTVCDGIIAII